MGDKTKPKKGKKKIVIIVLVVLVVVAAIIGSSVKKMTSQVATAVNTVEVEPVQKRDLSDTISLKGTVSGITKNNATSKALAEITAVNVQVGDIVKEGDVLCTLDSSTIQDQIADLEKNMSDTNATDSINSQQTAETVSRAKEDQQTQLAAAQKAIDDAKDAYNAQSIMWDKSEDKSDAEFQSLLAAQKAVTTAEEDYQKVLETTNRTIEDAQRAVELDKYKGSDSSSKDKLTDLKEQLEDCNITAPCGGVVTAVNVSVGDVNADSKTPLVTIEDTSSLKMVATVEEADILKIEEGMKATVTADAMGDETINGTVTRVVRVKGQSTGSDGQTTSGGYSVEISLDNKELLVGMEVKAKVMIKEKGEVLAIPYDLVKTDDDGNTYVLVAEANADGSATAVKKNITVGEEVDYYTEVTGGDLAEGDKLIYDYSGTVTEGQQFTPEQMYSEQDMGTGASTYETSDAEGMSTSVEGNEPVIRMENIVKTYYLGKPNELEILHGINLTVNKGEFVSIVGESGSGKSTLMNIIGVLDRQTQGNYYLEGQDVNGMSDEVRSAIRNRRIGFVFQNFNLLPRANALKNVMVPLLYGEEHSKNGKEHAMEMLKMVGMEDRADHRPNELSGGQKQRVAIARAMINDPAIILADEPTGALDSKTGHMVMDLFHKLHEEQGKTIVLITHSQELAQETERIVTLLDGQIVADNGGEH